MNYIKTMFLCGMSKDAVLDMIKRTLQSPDQAFTQDDGLLVRLKNFSSPVGEMIYFDEEGVLVTRILTTVKVVFTIDKHGNYDIVTAFPLLEKTR